jgi:putative oxidoreductase
VHSREVFTLGDQGGWALELQALMLFGALASMLLGPGRPAVNDR